MRLIYIYIYIYIYITCINGSMLSISLYIDITPVLISSARCLFCRPGHSDTSVSNYLRCVYCVYTKEENSMVFVVNDAFSSLIIWAEKHHIVYILFNIHIHKLVDCCIVVFKTSFLLF